MKRLITLILAFGLVANLYGQVYPALEKILEKEYSKDSKFFSDSIIDMDGRWVYYSEQANIAKIEKPLMKTILPNYDYYKVTMTCYLGYHIYKGTCIILFDSLKSNIILVQPTWYDGISEPLVKLFINKQFSSKEQLLNFLDELNNLLLTDDSSHKFVYTGSSDTLITYDLYGKHLYCTSNNKGANSKFTYYTKDEVWQQIEIKIKNLNMIEYTSINPAIKKDDEDYKSEYKRTIK